MARSSPGRTWPPNLARTTDVRHLHNRLARLERRMRTELDPDPGGQWVATPAQRAMGLCRLWTMVLAGQPRPPWFDRVDAFIARFEAQLATDAEGQAILDAVCPDEIGR